MMGGYKDSSRSKEENSEVIMRENTFLTPSIWKSADSIMNMIAFLGNR